MRTKNEKILLTILLLIIFLGGNFYGYQWLAKKQASLELSYAELKADKAEALVDLQNVALWKQRKAWVAEHQPPLGDEGDAKAQVLEYVQSGARSHKLEILEQTLHESQQGPSGTRVNVELKVKGSMEALCQWLSDLQKPANFYAVSSISLNADQDQKSMVCEVQLARYFKGGA